MKQNTQQLRTKLLTLIMAGVAGAGFAAAATAAATDTGANVLVPDTIQADGTADTHMSTSGSASSHIQSQSGTAPSTDRVTERMSTHSAELTPSADADLEAVGKTTTKRKP